jgi:phosphotransferase system  glucose/maltose/N-acetylglucosamine-specific IIC component
MKLLTTILLAVVAYFGITVSCIWSVIEFILYLVKDKEFNWWSVYMIFICAFTSLILSFLSLKSQFKNGSKLQNKNPIPKRSRFQEKLEQMEKQSKSGK